MLIRAEACELILGASKSLHPREFMGLLRMEKGIITEVLVLPASVWGDGFASVSEMHVPYDKTIVGSVHSHPTQNNRPSSPDLVGFGKSGTIHMIAGYPYRGIEDIACYGMHGERMELGFSDG